MMDRNSISTQSPSDKIRPNDAFSIIMTRNLIRAAPDRVSHFGYLVICKMSENP